MSKLSCRKISFLFYSVIFLGGNLFSACGVSTRMSKTAHRTILRDSTIQQAHIGISIYEPSTGKYLFNYQSDKYFIPASNTKLFSLYTGMKYMPDSLPILKYARIHDTIFAVPMGDPTFLDPRFTYQPLLSFLDTCRLPVIFTNRYFREEVYGRGWAWDDADEPFMPERNALPIYGNTSMATFKPTLDATGSIMPGSLTFSNAPIQPSRREYYKDNRLSSATIHRIPGSNDFEVHYPDTIQEQRQRIPFYTRGIATALEILNKRYPSVSASPGNFEEPTVTHTLFSQPTDSLLKPMMLISDNFMAEQLMLMASYQRFGIMNEEVMIESMLRTELRDIPQPVKWVDGSGLSRYNLFTPRSFVYILDKMNRDFGMSRLKTILPTGGQGTLKNSFLEEKGYIYAKSGTLSNNAALSGYLYTRKSRLLIFSIMVNNYRSPAGPVKASFERFLQKIREDF